MTIDIKKIIGEERLMLESLKAIAGRNNSRLGGLFLPEKPILK
ncbi:MAG: hypothetical protein QME74_07720 [Candidatus Edwardsbacteria bacterium]|nr:hypothetical protein [Candidatus Edwardsbacteria bacterium]